MLLLVSLVWLSGLFFGYFYLVLVDLVFLVCWFSRLVFSFFVSLVDLFRSIVWLVCVLVVWLVRKFFCQLVWWGERLVLWSVFWVCLFVCLLIWFVGLVG